MHKRTGSAIKLIGLCGFLFTMLSCSSQRNCTNCGLVVSKLKFFDTVAYRYIDNQIYWPDHKIWYKDSMVIEEISGIYIKTDTAGQEWRKVEVLHYTFIDLRSRSFYDYITFSDTARIIKQYTQPDSLGVPGGSFFYVPRDLTITEPVQVFTDTVIENIIYKRIKFSNGNRSSIGYLQCDRKGTLFQFYKLYGEKVGCPMVRIDDLSTPESPISTSSQVDFVIDHLTQEELKVFSAWERNAKRNPIK